MATSVANCGSSSAAASARAPCTTLFPVADYNLQATLESGQAFRWYRVTEGWESVVAGRWVRLAIDNTGLRAESALPVQDWTWLANYLQIDTDLESIQRTFPRDDVMRKAVRACRGLRLLRQDPWECLASFVLSSTKQITQIRQVVALLCERFGNPVPVPPGVTPAWSFPPPQRLAQITEGDLRACKMGFRAPYLREIAQRVARGLTDLEAVGRLSCAEARLALTDLPGVGPKIADCVLLFAYGFPTAFPVDVWIIKVLKEFYFPRQPDVTPRTLRQFAATYFGPFGGYAQQYLFHYARTRKARVIKIGTDSSS